MSIRVMSAMLTGGNSSHSSVDDKQHLVSELHCAVKECQTKYGGRTELATEVDSRIVRLCTCFEAVLSHGLKQPNASTLRQVAELVAGAEPLSFWTFVSSQLTPHERERYSNLRQVWTDRGRARALIRAALNERSLERYLHCWLAHSSLFQCYEEWALLRDTEASSMLPSMAAGLVSILFAIQIDLPELNVNRASNLPRSEPTIAVRIPELVVNVVKKSRKRQVISFDDEGNSVSPSNVSSQWYDKSVALRNANVCEHPTDSHGIIPKIESLRNSIHTHSIESHDSQMSNDTYDLDQEITDLCTPLSDSGVCESHSTDRAESVGSDLSSLRDSVASEESSLSNADLVSLKARLDDKEERCNWLEARVAELSLENHRLRIAVKNNSMVNGPFFNLDIPKAHKIGSHYEYQVMIKARGNEEWSVLRRYKDFYNMHRVLCKKNAGVSALDFPPKKTLGNMDSVFVEERRQRLQAYLRQLIILLPDLSLCNTKSQLERTLPFLRAT